MSREEEQQPLDPKVREALFELQRYLSDTLAPLMVADSVNLLLDHPAHLAANEIQTWTTTQLRSAKPAPVSDYLYHAVEKLHAMGQYQLVPQDPLQRYIEDLKPLVLELCPVADRTLLARNLGRLRKTEVIPEVPAEILRRQGGLAARSGLAASGLRREDSSLERASHLRELSLLIERLGLPGASAERRDVLLSQILTLAAMAARTDAELRAALDKLRSIGVDVPTTEVFRALGRSVPPWSFSAPSEPLELALMAAKRAPTAAMRRVVTLPENPEEIGRRFGELVAAAIEQLNKGSIARAARMFAVADTLVAENRVDSLLAGVARRWAQKSVDLERVRSLGKDSRNHEPLGRILSFFPALTATKLIDELHGEEKRERRRLLLSLLEIHGAEVRATALGLLARSRAGEPGLDWHFKRNLLYLLRRIPRATEEPTSAELDVLISFADPSLPAPLVKEAIAGLGVARHERSEAALVSIVQGLESMLEKRADALFGDEAELRSLLDRAVSALARFGSGTSRRVVVEHGLRRKGGLGDERARLTELAGQDLSDNPDLVGVLLRGLKADLPFKVFGLTPKKRDDKIGPIIDALSSTPLPQVKSTFEEIVGRYPGTPFANAATRALAAFDAPRADESAAAASLSGRLAIFELPSLLESLAASEVTGTLTLRNASGAVMGSLLLESGRIREAECGALRGDEACYQLFERPGGATFAFVRQLGLAPRGENEPPLREIVSVLLEGMRRYDEVQRCSALVPDDAVFKQTSSKPSAEPEEHDAGFQQAIFSQAVSGLNARAIEAAAVADSFRVRRLLARWVEDGSLKLA